MSVPSSQPEARQNTGEGNVTQVQESEQHQIPQSQEEAKGQGAVQGPNVDALQAVDDHISPENKQIFTYEAPWLVYSLGFSWREGQEFRLAIGSLVEEVGNKIRIIQLDKTIEGGGDFVEKCTIDHEYPATKVLWLPDKSTSNLDLFATSGDYMRLWEVDETGKKVSLKAILNENAQCQQAPLTSFDWNKSDPTTLGTCSIDTTCTIWDIQTQEIKAQLIAHDKEVFDIGFAKDANTFATTGADGSIRHFDIRSLQHSSILYESTSNSQDPNALLRLEWNNQNPYYIATFEIDSHKVLIIDARVPMIPVCTLEGHQSYVNTFSWAPHSSCHICTAGDDKQALIWDLSVMPQPVRDPILSYRAEAEVSFLQWSQSQPDWVAVSFDKKVQMLRV